eukprot:scaffold278485_cov33-Tisochrysis_lutea.AAC.9
MKERTRALTKFPCAASRIQAWCARGETEPPWRPPSRWRTRVSNVDDFLEPRHAKSDVLGRDTGVVERVQSHLRSGLANGLGGERANHLPRLDAVLKETVFDLAEKPIEGLWREPVLAEDTLRRKLRPQQREKVVGSVVLRLDREAVRTLDHSELGQQISHLAVRQQVRRTEWL